jgi:hypothetical protein
MTAVYLVIGAVLLCLMIAITAYGWVKLPPGHRVGAPTYRVWARYA